MDSGLFDSIVPSHYVSFHLPNPPNPSFKDYLQTPRIRIAILDSHPKPPDPPLVAAILVPRGRENDWIFSTEAGHFQLLSAAPHASRLILIGNHPHSTDFCLGNYTRSVDDDPGKLEGVLHPLLVQFLPKKYRESGRTDIPFLRLEDNVISSVALVRLVGPVVGEMLVQDVEIEGDNREFRRRLRFKRMPNLVQSEIRIVPVVNCDLGTLSLKELKFQPDLGVLVHPCLPSMVASVSLIDGYLQECHDSGIRPRALCIGVGGGALPGFLANQLGFEVVGLEVDEVVLRVAREHFGLGQCELVQLSVGDGIESLKNIASNKGEYDCTGANFDASGRKFDVIMVDLDPSSVPLLEFVKEGVFLGAKSCLSGNGLLVVNVMLTEILAHRSFIEGLKEVFVEVYEIDSENEESSAVVATMSRADHVSGGTNETEFLKKLRSVMSEAVVGTIMITSREEVELL